MLSFPMEFKIIANSKSGIETQWRSSGSGHEANLAIPPEFQGPGGGFSPEDLYGMALANCYVATFKVMAEKSRLSFEDLQVEASLFVDRGEGGRPWMAQMKMNVQLKGASDRDKAESLLKRTSESCMILNSVKTEKHFEFHLS